MGIDLFFYVIEKKMEHDPTKICLELECEPHTNYLKLQTRFFHIIHPTAKPINRDDYQMEMDYYVAHHNRRDEEYRVWDTCKYADLWCPKCKMYKYGFWGCDYIIDKLNIHHSAGNPIWDSDWNIRQFSLGDSMTDFIRGFTTEYPMLREISEDDIARVYEIFEELGDPPIQNDIDAKEETIYVLEFLQKYAKRDDVRLIISDE